MEYNTEIKSRIEKKLKEEEEEVRVLLEGQTRAERLTRPEDALGRWLSIREEKAMNDLATSLTIMTVAEGITELDEDGNTMMKLEETEAEIDVWLSIQIKIAEEQVNNAGKMLECEHMELEEEICGIDTMDDNNTTDDNPEASYEE